MGLVWPRLTPCRRILGCTDIKSSISNRNCIAVWAVNLLNDLIRSIGRIGIRIKFLQQIHRRHIVIFHLVILLRVKLLRRNIMSAVWISGIDDAAAKVYAAMDIDR